MPQIVFEGTVFSGNGNGKKFVDLPWVKRQIEEKLGFSPYSGTLNLRLNKEGKEKRTLLENAKGFLIEPQASYCPGILFKACINSFECAVVDPKVPNYPKDVLEIIAPVYLRGSLKLVDGSVLVVEVKV